MTAADLAAAIYIGLAALLIVGTISGIRAFLRWCDAEVERHVQTALRDQAADHGEPPRADIEAGYGPLTLWGPTDAEADDKWADVLAPFDLTPEDMRAAHNAHRLNERMDRIRDSINENEVDRFRREIEAWAGGAAS
jgi:hypothetical protein